jgi:hypothetical protein
MTYSKNVIQLANEIAHHYSKFNSLNDQYEINIEDVSDFDLRELAAQIMLEDRSLASEANGPDNPAFDTKMFPALIRFMKDSTSKDESIEFIREWEKGVTSYFMIIMTDLINNSLENIRNDRSYVSNKTYREQRATYY